MRYFMRRRSPAWEVESAELWIVEPREERLTTNPEIPVLLLVGSKSSHVKANLVYVAEGSGRREGRLSTLLPHLTPAVDTPQCAHR
jgi:hypothetical protein